MSSDQKIEYITQSFLSLRRDGEEMNLDDILKLIHEISPNWVKSIHNNYSSDYPHLTNNWNNLCKMIHRVQKQRRRRACTEIQKPSLTAVEGLTISNTQMFRLEGAVL